MFSNPQKNVTEFGFNPGQKVIDVGSGGGHYTFPLSKSVGNEGQIYSLDIKKESLIALRNQATRDGFNNIEVIWGDIEKMGGTKLKNEVVDGVVFSNLLFQLADKNTALMEANRILKSGGKLCVVEWSELSFMSGIKHEGQNLIINKEDVIKLIVSAGFKQEKSFDAGEHHYGLVFLKPTSTASN